MNTCSQQDQCKIESFDKEFRFLSNFYRAPLMYRGIAYPTSEHAYQAAKTINEAAAVEKLADALEVGYKGFGEIACTDAAREGISAFLERRRPVFQK